MKCFILFISDWNTIRKYSTYSAEKNKTKQKTVLNNMSEVLPFFEKFSTHSFVFLRSRGSDIWGSDQIIAAERGIIWAKASMTHRVSDLEVYVSKSLPLNVEQLAKHTPKNFYAYRTFLRGTVGNCSQVSAFHFSGLQIITMSAKEQREGLESEVTQLPLFFPRQEISVSFIWI